MFFQQVCQIGTGERFVELPQIDKLVGLGPRGEILPDFSRSFGTAPILDGNLVVRWRTKATGLGP